MPDTGFRLALSVLAAYTNGAAPANSPPEWFAVAFLLFFVGMWILVMTVLGWIGGHMALLGRFPPVDEPREPTFRWTSGAMRAGVSYNNALYVGLGARGLHLAPIALFRPVFRRGIPCIPWQEIRLVRPQPAGIAAWFKGSKFEIPAVGVRFALAGAAGRAVERRLSTGKPATDPPRSRLVRE